MLNKRRHVERRSAGAVDPLCWIERDVKIIPRVSTRGRPRRIVSSGIGVHGGFRPRRGGFTDGDEGILVHVGGREFKAGVHHFVGSWHGQRTEIHVDQRHRTEVRVAGRHLATADKEAGRRTAVGVDVPRVKVGVGGDRWVSGGRDDGALLDGKRSVRAVDLLTDIVGEVEDGRRASWAQHAVVHRLDHPANFLSEGQVLWGCEGQVGGVKGGRRGSGVVGVEPGHVIAGVGLDEHAPPCGSSRAAVGPREGGRAVRLKGVGGGVPHDGAAGWRSVYATDGRGGHGAVFPDQGEIRSFAGTALGRRERDFVRGLARGVNHERDVVLSGGQRSLHGFRHVKVHPVVFDAGNEVNVATDVRPNGTATALRPGIGAVVRRGVGRGGPGLQHGADGHGFVLNRPVFGKEAQLGTGHTGTARLGHFTERNTNQRRRLVASGGFTHDQRGGILLGVIGT